MVCVKVAWDGGPDERLFAMPIVIPSRLGFEVVPKIHAQICHRLVGVVLEGSVWLQLVKLRRETPDAGDAVPGLSGQTAGWTNRDRTHPVVGGIRVNAIREKSIDRSVIPRILISLGNAVSCVRHNQQSRVGIVEADEGILFVISKL